MRQVKWCIILVLLPLSFGCSPNDRVTEEDREAVDLQWQIADAQEAEMSRLATAIRSDPMMLQDPAAAFTKLREMNNDAREIAKQLGRNFGPPDQPQIYSNAEMPGFLTRLKKSHEVGFWGMLGAAVLAGGATALGIARKFGKFVPGFGPVFAALDTTLEGVEKWMQKKKDGGKTDDVAELAAILKGLHSDAKVGTYIDKALGKVKDRLGIEPAALESALANVTMGQAAAAVSEVARPTAADTKPAG